MVKIRLRRTGAKKKPNYRVVVADSRTPRDGRFIEIVGHYDPKSNPSTVEVHEDRILYWLSVGAQPTDQVRKLLDNLGTLDRFGRLKEGADLAELLAEARAAHEARQSEAAAEKVEAKKEAATPPEEPPAETEDQGETVAEEETAETESSDSPEEPPAETEDQGETVAEEETAETESSNSPEEPPAEPEEASSDKDNTEA